jgi:hypothetical protein
MSPRAPRPESFRSSLLPHLALPIGTAQPSLVLVAVTASFLIAFSLTFCFVGSIPKSQQPPGPLSPSFGFLYPA